jgi:acetyl-CoA synthetase
MIGLRDLRVPEARTWEEAYRSFRFPRVDRYSIAEDCLRGRRDAPAVIEVGDGAERTMTFGQLRERVARVANGLVGLGVGPGDRVAVKLSQSLDMATTILATLQAGGVVVPLSNVLATDGLRHRLADSGPRVMIGQGTEEEVALAGEFDTAFLATPSLEDLARRGAPRPPAATEAAPDDPALLLYTSGTTGKPKGVLHGNRVLLGHHPLDLALDRIRSDDVSYSPVDWAWAGGLLLGLLVPLAHGIPVLAFRDPRFDAEKTLGIMEAAGVSVGLFPPTVLRMLRGSGRFTREHVSSTRLRCFVTGAEAVEPELAAWSEDIGLSLNNAFGQTEANALIGHAATLGALDPAALGRPYPGRIIALLNDALEEVAPAEAGQIAISADDPVCMLRYWKAPEGTAEKLKGGWLLTGDTAHADADGTLYFHGRSDDIIKSGAYRIGPAEVEAALRVSDAVEECAVVGLPDEIRGQVVAAFVKLKDETFGGRDVTEELQSLARRRVGAHAYPREVRYVSSFPKTSTGKVDRAALRREAELGLESTS